MNTFLFNYFLDKLSWCLFIYYYTLNNYALFKLRPYHTTLEFNRAQTIARISYNLLIGEFHCVTLLITPLIVAEILSRHILCNITSHTTSKYYYYYYIITLCSCIFDIRSHYRLLFVSTLSSYSIHNWDSSNWGITSHHLIVDYHT